MSKTYKVGVVGAGNMGSGIAQKLAQEGLLVTLVDVKEEFVSRGLSNIKNTLQEGVNRKVFTPEQMEATLTRVEGTVSMEALADADLVIEAVFEDLEVKGQLFKKLDEICQPHTILATNTSSFYVNTIASYTNRQDKVIGMHYFYHPAKNRLLEIVPHNGTSEQTIEKAWLIGKLHGKTNILVKDAPGFAVNRFFVPFLTESVRLLEEGKADIPTIDAAAKEAFSIGMGPFELMNVTGIPIAAHSSETLGREISTFYSTPDLLIKQMNARLDWDLSGEVDQSKFDIVTDRLYATVMGVASALVDEGVATIEDTDRGAKIGLRWRYGPFELINMIGIEKAYKLVKSLADSRPGFKRSPLLEEQYRLGKPFEFNFVDLDIKDDIAFITINRPEAMNALNPVVVNQLEKKFNEAETNPSVKAIAFQGSGKAFIAGADIKFFVDCIKTDNMQGNVEFTSKGHELFRRFETSSKLTVAVLDGLSLGGGSELALSCQAIIATPTGSFGFPETGIGIYPGLGGMIRMERHVGPELAKYFVFTGKTLRANEAHALGIVNAVVESTEIEDAIKNLIEKGNIDKYASRFIPEAFEEQKIICSSENVVRLFKGEQPKGVNSNLAEKTAKIIAKKAPLALMVVNELIDAQSKVSIDEAIQLELSRLTEIFSTEDALIGLESSPGNPPQFKGKTALATNK